MWPGFETTCYWNGYRWHHSTDDRGFRNPPAVGSDVLLLGDSMIYGHGVEEEVTLAHDLRQRWGVAAYNMGRQGSCLYDHYVFLRTYLDQMRPRTVVLFVFLNDFHDLEIYRTGDEIDQIPELTRDDYSPVFDWASTLRDRLPAAPTRWLFTRPSLRLLSTLPHALGQVAIASPAWATDKPADGPDYLDTFYDPERLAKVGRYYERVLADLAGRCREIGCELRLVYLSAGFDARRWDFSQRRAVGLVAEVARENALLAYDTRALFDGCEACFLPNDGHLTVRGHATLARLLAESVVPGVASPELLTPIPRAAHRPRPSHPHPASR